MKIIVCVKQVPHVSEIKVDKKTQKPILSGVNKKISDMDKNALEEAIKIKEKYGGKITILSVGETESNERIKELLAMGADEGIMIKGPEESDYYIISKILSQAIKKIGDYDIILFGEASIDQFSGQMGPRIAALLNLPQLTYVQKLHAGEKKVTVERVLGDRVVTEESPYPVVITVTKEINEPRLPSLMQILGAVNKPIYTWDLESLGIEGIAPKVKTVEIKGVLMERKNIVFSEDVQSSVNQLAEVLLKEGILR